MVWFTAVMTLLVDGITEKAESEVRDFFSLRLSPVVVNGGSRTRAKAVTQFRPQGSDVLDGTNIPVMCLEVRGVYI